MRGGAELRLVPRVVRLGKPEDAQGRPPLAEHLLAEALRHERITRLTLLDIEMLGVHQRYQAWAEGAGRVIDMPEAVGILEVRSPRRHVRHHDGAAVVRETLRERRSQERASRRLAHALAELGPRHGETDEPGPFVEHHRVAEQAVPSGMATRGDGGRGDARDRREYTAATRVPLDGAAGKR